MKLFFALAAMLMAAGNFYTNPILHSDYSDPDVICVDGHYWMTSSSFGCVPGLQILHSTNLVDWELVNAGLPQMYGPAGEGSTAELAMPEHGNRVWAPSIRYFDGLYWIFWGDPDLGVFQIHATHPCGEWSKPHCIWEGKGMIDTCPLLDDDGRMYLVHGWAGSRAGFKSVLSVCEMDRACTRLIGEQVLVFNGKQNGNETVEGPKFYKRNGWYYIFAPAGGVKEGWQLVMRSRSPFGPYEWRNVMHQGNTDIHGPHQGGWVSDAEGKDWFLHFEDRYAWGRVVHLQPMSWSDDDWCIIGVDSNADGIGEPVLKHKVPAAYSQPRLMGHKAGEPAPGFTSALETGTDFTGTSIPLNWQWNGQPHASWAMMNPSEGSIRLNCVNVGEDWHNLWDSPNLLLEKVVGPKMSLEARLDFSPSYKGDRCGLVVMGLDYSALELIFDGEAVYLQRTLCRNADKGNPQQTSDRVKLTQKSVWMKVTIEGDCICSFHYSLDGRHYKKIGTQFKAREGKWIGAKTGFYASADIKKNDGGSVEIH